MNIVPKIIAWKRTYVVVIFAMLSLLLAAYGPMTMYSQAQSVNDAKLQELKDKVLTELNRRIGNYKKTIQNLSVDVHTSKESTTLEAVLFKRTISAQSDKDGSSSTVTKSSGTTVTRTTGKDGRTKTVTGPNGSRYGYTIDKTGIHGDIFISTAFKEKVKDYLQKIVDGLESMVEKVKNSTAISKLKELASNIDTQYIVDQVTQVQGAITQAVDSMNGALDNLRTGFNNMQTRMTQLKECLKGLKSGDTSADVSIAQSGSSVSCGDFKVTSEDVANRVQAQLDNLKSIVSTIGSVASSIVTLLISLVTQFASLVSSLGNLSNLGNISNLSGLLSGGGLSGLTGGSSAASSLMSSFSGVLSQLNLVSGMASGAQSGLSSISSLVNL